MANEVTGMTGNKSYTATLLLAFFLGGFGIHRFYTGYIGIGILQLLTGGGFGIWLLIDLFSIALNKFVDANGGFLAGYNKVLANILLVLLIISVVLCIIGIFSALIFPFLLV